jgi:radical SAM protein with 4Fe4S-binding SPASM domain
MYKVSKTFELIEGIDKPALVSRYSITKYVLNDTLYIAIKQLQNRKFSLQSLRKKISDSCGSEMTSAIIRFLLQERIIIESSEREVSVDPTTLYFEKRELKSIIMEITDKCNFACPHCSRNCSSRNNTTLDKQVINDVLKWSTQKNITNIYFTGGEPLLHPDINEILALVKHYGVRTSLVSNGSLIDCLDVKTLLSSNIDFHISLYGGDQYYTSYACDGVTSGMIKNNIVKLKALMNDRVCVTMPVMKCNQKYLKPITEFCRKQGIRFYAGLCAPFGRGLSGWGNQRASVNIVKGKMKTLFLSNSQLAKTNRAFYFPCSINNLCIMANMNITNCVNLPNHAIAVYDDKKSPDQLLKIFDSREFKKSQKEFAVNNRAFCKKCEFKHDCGGGCPARAKSYFGSFDLPDPLCLYHKNIEGKCKG